VQKKYLWKNYKNIFKKVAEVERRTREIEKVVEVCKHFVSSI
jgi:hypothetical protein